MINVRGNTRGLEIPDRFGRTPVLGPRQPPRTGNQEYREPFVRPRDEGRREDRDPLSRSYDDANRNYDPCCASRRLPGARGYFAAGLLASGRRRHGASAALKARGLNGGKAEGSSVGETVLGITVKIEDANREGEGEDFAAWNLNMSYTTRPRRAFRRFPSARSNKPTKNANDRGSRGRFMGRERTGKVAAAGNSERAKVREANGGGTGASTGRRHGGNRREKEFRRQGGGGGQFEEDRNRNIRSSAAYRKRKRNEHGEREGARVASFDAKYARTTPV